MEHTPLKFILKRILMRKNGKPMNGRIVKIIHTLCIRSSYLRETILSIKGILDLGKTNFH